MVVTKYLTVLSGKYPANLYRIPDSAGCLVNFTGIRIRHIPIKLSPPPHTL
jgi:hypothetical protein